MSFWAINHVSRLFYLYPVAFPASLVELGGSDMEQGHMRLEVGLLLYPGMVFFLTIRGRVWSSTSATAVHWCNSKNFPFLAGLCVSMLLRVSQVTPPSGLPVLRRTSPRGPAFPSVITPCGSAEIDSHHPARGNDPGPNERRALEGP